MGLFDGGMGALSTFSPQIKKYFKKKVQKLIKKEDVEVYKIELCIEFPKDDEEEDESGNQINNIRIYTNYGNYKMPKL